MPADSAPPPIYSQEDPDDSNRADGSSASETQTAEPPGPQILIVPTSDEINFQKGFLGADGERAAIEGDLQIKGHDANQWAQIDLALRTVESAYEREIELGSSRIVLFSAGTMAENESMPSSFPFAIPLTPDAPQCIHTPQSSLKHILTATLYPANHAGGAISKSLVVHTRRYTAHSHVVQVAPETSSLTTPTRVDVQVPRTTFKAGEPVPIYVTIPPPPRELVLEQGLRLRNVRAELIRIVRVKRSEEDDFDPELDADAPVVEHEKYPFHNEGPSNAATSTAVEKADQPSTSAQGQGVLPASCFYKTVISRSGGSCRFHSSRPILLRFVLHQPSPSGSPADFQVNLPAPEHGHLDNDTECASITQSTLLHEVSFRINVHVSFVDMSSRTERFHTVSIPVNVIAPPAPLPQVDDDVYSAYQKKHDKPPARTVRADEAESSAPHYEEGVAGPSGAPPPFEERDAPPPFFSESSASTSNRLPTFLESESEIYVPSSEDSSGTHAQLSGLIEGEGTLFGFAPSQQFDGHTEEMQRSSTPPPTLEMATRDANVTELADLHEPERAIEALGLVLEQHEEAQSRNDMPPPPPAMDDPSDPPPSIDSDFRLPTGSQQQLAPHPSPGPTVSSFSTSGDQGRVRSPSPSPTPQPDHGASHGHAPPPYLGSENHGEEQHVTRPPPYVDLMPNSSERQ